ncbi:PREDICTED: glycerophosphodiester phosphodiesterase domain-containing protein 4 isoform X2 [Rhinopithecus bieti]|uniref:glycerophosphodiester phosphodiesterase domain-containing protein 4 isoform X2 n=1 Tax=Rhinopithecus bieti TaxID=61621 RepID=UPI00083BB2D5|nr:PREDICTED: glycerophosphodiester phosphodiesterase domain-containing protein 4 isoform X2 [Rhinopithecus bieti]
MFKKVNRIEHKRNKTGKPKKLNPWIPRIFNHQCYVTFLTGCYSCLWKFRQWEKTKVGFCCCTWKEQLFCPCLVISFVLSLMLLFLWIETSNEYFNFDWVTFLGTGYWFFWSIFILSLAGILTAYSSLLLLLGFLLLWEGIELYLHLCHKILILLVILACVILMFIICKFWKERWLVAGLSLQIFAPYVHLVSITVMVILFWPVAIYVARLEREVRMRRYRMTHSEKKRLKKCNVIARLRGLQVAVGLPFLLILLSLCLMPLGIYSPCIQEKENLGPKPTIFGHRGAPMLGPENTMMSFEKAVEHGAHGLETDIHLSYDRVPFLMHDFDLRRTTNIWEVQPESAFKNPAAFSWDFLSTLNAGKWFVKPEADKERARNQSIPTLADLLTLAKKERKFVIFDLHGPPPKHPLRHTFVRQVVSVILASKIEQHLIFWLPTHDRQYVRSMAPGFQHVGRLVSVKTLAKNNISIINVDYKKLFPNGLRDYKAANIHINVYTVNEPWLFSLAWCSRINSVTTDNIGLLSQLHHPHFFMTPKFYMFIWLLADIISVLFIVAIFCFHWRRETKKEKLFETSSTLTDAQSRRENEEDLHIAMKPPARVVESPWTLAALYPALSKSGKEHQGRFNFAAPSKKLLPIKNAVTPLKPSKHDIQPPMPTTVFELTQAPSRQATSKATFQTPLPTLKVDKPTMPSIEVPYP